MFNNCIFFCNKTIPMPFYKTLAWTEFENSLVKKTRTHQNNILKNIYTIYFIYIYTYGGFSVHLSC